MRETPPTLAWPKALDRILVAAFIVAISLPGLVMLARPPFRKSTAPTGEVHPSLRELRANDKTSLETARTLKKWFETRFPFRDHLIVMDGLLRVRLFGISISSSVLVGSDGWLFYTGEGALDVYRRTQPFSTDQLEAWGHTIDTWASMCAKVDAQLVIVVVPEKATVYSEEMPAWTKPLPNVSRFDQLADVVKKRSDVTYVDVRPALEEARRGGTPLYYRTDTHWNDLAGYIASREVSIALARRNPSVVIPPPVTTGTVTSLAIGGDLARFLGLKNHLHDEDVSVKIPHAQATINVVSDNVLSDWTRRADLKRDMTKQRRVQSARADAPLGRALILRDSFANALIPSLAENFGEARFLWTSWLDRRELEEFKPNVVIIEFAERYLMRDPNDILNTPGD